MISTDRTELKSKRRKQAAFTSAEAVRLPQQSPFQLAYSISYRSAPSSRDLTSVPHALPPSYAHARQTILHPYTPIQRGPSTAEKLDSDSRRYRNSRSLPLTPSP